MTKGFYTDGNQLDNCFVEWTESMENVQKCQWQSIYHQVYVCVWCLVSSFPSSFNGDNDDANNDPLFFYEQGYEVRIRVPLS